MGTKFQILVEVSTKRESCSQGASFVCKDQMRNQIVVHCYSWLAKRKSIVLSQTIHESSTHALIKGVVAAVVPISSSEVCSLCCAMKNTRFGDWAIKEDIAEQRSWFSKLWVDQIPGKSSLMLVSWPILQLPLLCCLVLFLTRI